MSNTTNKATLNYDPKNYRANWIDPLQIFGVSDAVERAVETGNDACILDHQDFPNPRLSMDKEIIDEVKEAGYILMPVCLYFNSEGEAIVIDGKTRLTGIAQYIADCRTKGEEPEYFKRIEFVRFKGDDQGARFEAVKLNLGDNSRPLSEPEVAIAIQRYMKCGFTSEEIASSLNKQGRGGKQWVNKYLEIYNGNPELIEAFTTGKLDGTTAIAIARHVPFNEQASITEKAVKNKESGKSDKEVRRDVGLRKASRTTLSFSGTMALVEEVLPDFLIVLKRIEDGEFPEPTDLCSMEEAQAADYLGESCVLEQVRVLSKVLKIDDRPVKDQIVFFIENSSQEVQEALPEIKFDKNSKLMKSTSW